MKLLPVLMVVYKSKSNFWRGFCMPYGLDVQASSKKKAMKFIENLVEEYQQRLEKYGYPEHLVKGRLYDNEDKEIFGKVWPKVSMKIAEMVKRASYSSYENVIGGEEKKMTLKDIFVTYSNRPYAPC